MLRFLAIRNLAVIDRLELEFEPGMNALTGETGAGKSILVGAVGLLMGGRASSDVIRTGEDMANIEAVFDAPNGEELILRREISAQGRSRAFIDGALATTAALREAGAGLVDLHGQHEHQVLLDPSSHLDLLDTFAGLTAERDMVARAFADWRALKDDCDRAAASARDRAARGEFLAFQLSEIERAAPAPGEDQELTGQRQVLANADRLERLCAEAYDALYEGEQAVLSSLGLVWRRLADLASIDARFTPYVDARTAVKSQLEDLAFFLRSYSAGIDASADRLQRVEDRLAQLERVKKKYGPSLDEVLATAARLRREIEELGNEAGRTADLEGSLVRARGVYVTRAGALSAHRAEAAVTFAAELGDSLAELAMARTRCEVRFAPASSETGWSARGTEQAEFFMSTNPGEDLRPLARIASGGELSRIMLALKTLASNDAPGKTLVFDEVDAGIGGAVADVVGGRLQHLATRFQILCITHLPQIAAHAATHFHIAKAVRQGRTMTTVARLGLPDREDELARMIGGQVVSAAVRSSAAEMIRARSGEAKGEYRSKGESERSRGRKP